MNSLLKGNQAAEEFYNNSLVKSRLESDDPVRGAFNGAYGDAQRTMRGIGKNANNKQIKDELFKIVSDFYNDVAKNFSHYSLRDFDGSFCITCTKMIETSQQLGFAITFGQAQKIVNMFFKYMFLIDERLNIHAEYLHIPFDSIILNGIANDDSYSAAMRKVAKCLMPWSKMAMDDYKAYMLLQDYLREKHSIPIIFEFDAWNKWKKIL